MYTDALAFLEDERDAWRPYEALSQLTDEQLERPVAGAHGWSGRDLMGHLLTWQLLSLDVAKERAVGERSAARTRAEADWEERGGDAVNAEADAFWRAKSIDDVRQEFARVAGELRGFSELSHDLSESIAARYWSYALQVGGYQNASSAVGAFALSTTFRGNRVGAAVKYVDQRNGVLHDGAPSLDLGISRDVSRYTLGIAVQNIGDGIHFSYGSAQLPLRVSAGVSSYGWIVGPFDVSGAAGASVLPDGTVLPALGLEFGYVPMEGYAFAFRAGIRRPELRAQQPLSVGGSAALDRFALEYAYEDWVNGATHRLALRVR